MDFSTWYLQLFSTLLRVCKEYLNSLSSLVLADLPKLDLVLDLSIIACLLGLFNTERLAREISAVTLVMDILLEKKEILRLLIQSNTSAYPKFKG